MPSSDQSTSPQHLVPPTPISFLERSARVYSDRPRVVDGEVRLTYAELHERSQRLAGALREAGLGRGRKVAFLSPNTHALLEGHFGVPASRGVLVAMNTRLAPAEFAYILEHFGADILIYDESLLREARAAAELSGTGVRVVESGGPDSEYERWLSDTRPLWEHPTDETGMLSINYTSGSTGTPKGVVYHHRGAFLQALAWHSMLGSTSTPHTYGRSPCSTPTAGASRGRSPSPAPVTGGAPPDRLGGDLEGDQDRGGHPPLRRPYPPAHAGGAPRRQRRGTPTDQRDDRRDSPLPCPTRTAIHAQLDVIHLYGLTEAFGPAAICDWRPEWNELPAEEQAILKARQGVGNVTSQSVRVVDADGRDVPADAETIGEMAIIGNNEMAGYFRDLEATARAVPDGWFRTGDLAVMHPDGYVEIRDRKKDIVISAGRTCPRWRSKGAGHPSRRLRRGGMRQTRPEMGRDPGGDSGAEGGANASEAEFIDHVRSLIAHSKAPKEIRFRDLPRTSTGKIQKHMLRSSIEET